MENNKREQDLKKNFFLQDEAKEEFPGRGVSKCSYVGGLSRLRLSNSDNIFIYTFNNPRQMLNFCERYFPVKGCRGGHCS